MVFDSVWIVSIAWLCNFDIRRSGHSRIITLYLFGLKAVIISLIQDTTRGAIWHVAGSNMATYKGIEVMNR